MPVTKSLCLKFCFILLIELIIELVSTTWKLLHFKTDNIGSSLFICLFNYSLCLYFILLLNLQILKFVGFFKKEYFFTYDVNVRL